MTAKPGPRRKRRSPPGAGQERGWETRHSPYTIEGEIEGFSRLAAGSTGRPRRQGGRRLLATFVVVAMAAPFAIAMVVQLVQLFD